MDRVKGLFTWSPEGFFSRQDQKKAKGKKGQMQKRPKANKGQRKKRPKAKKAKGQSTKKSKGQIKGCHGD